MSKKVFEKSRAVLEIYHSCSGKDNIKHQTILIYMHKNNNKIKNKKHLEIRTKKNI